MNYDELISLERKAVFGHCSPMSGLLIFSCVFGDELYVGLGKSILGRFSLQFVKMSKRKAFDRC